ncbi:MAG TPA: HYR domain-containing protein, partial [Vicinamibacterales bacterium]|nr:HYR domain-containing protein [Vicinamibacterales bacterium]
EPLATIECPAPITVSNDPGKCNAVVAFAPKVDGMCPGVTAVSTPPSGTAFGVGTNNVTAYAQWQNVQSPACMFSVTVKDVEGPQISCPAPMTVDATGPQGATVSFAPVATDNCSATVASAPASGSMFAIGTTPVNSTAQDPSGNGASCSFTVHVKGAAEQLGDLITAVTGMSMKDGTRNGLLAKLNAALADLATSGACGPLGAFINLVQAHQGKDIAAGDGAALIAKATQIRTVLGC